MSNIAIVLDRCDQIIKQLDSEGVPQYLHYPHLTGMLQSNVATLLDVLDRYIKPEYKAELLKHMGYRNE